jgi:hypothetical protein
MTFNLATLFNLRHFSSRGGNLRPGQDPIPAFRANQLYSQVARMIHWISHFRPARRIPGIAF